MRIHLSVRNSYHDQGIRAAFIEEQTENVKVVIFIFLKCASENPKAATPIDRLKCRLQFRSKHPKSYTRGLPRLSPGD